jgi:hypothetical protein
MGAPFGRPLSNASRRMARARARQIRKRVADAPVAEWHGSADPEALSFGGGDLVPHAFPDHLPLELGE